MNYEEFNLSNGKTLYVPSYSSNMVLYIFDDIEGEDICSINISVDSCRGFTYEENLKSLIEEINEYIELTNEDRDQIEDAVRIDLYSMSADPYLDNTKAIFTYTDIYGEHKELVNVAPVNDNFEIVDESDIYIDLDDQTKTYHYSDLEFID